VGFAGGWWALDGVRDGVCDDDGRFGWKGFELMG